MMNRKNLILCAALLGLGLGGCSGAKEKLGLVKESPDEFAVVKRAPLSMPPDYDLRPPTPGAPRPQEQATSAQARAAIYGGEAQSSYEQTDAEGMLVHQAGGDKANPDIRRLVDVETAKLGEENKPVVKKLLNIGGVESEPAASVVNAKEEAERLRKNAEEGKPVTAGETPSIEQ